MKKITIPGILLLYHLPFGIRKASTIEDHIHSFARYSAYQVYSVNTEFGFPKNLSHFDFDIVVLHYSLFGGWWYYFDQQFLEYLQTVSSYKVAFFQDEYHYCPKRFDFINKYKLNAIYTCYEPQYYAQTYGKYTSVQTLKTCIPGYVSEEIVLAAQRYGRPDAERSIDIGYRGRPLPYHTGKGGREKYEIGREFLSRSQELGLVMDIGIEEKNRIYGNGWYKFIGNCKGVLGVESGVSISDLDGVVQKQCGELIQENPKSTFLEVYQRVLFRWENNIPLRTVSPRHFEAAAFRCCQILFVGNYSGILEPMVHYIPLEKDYSNLDDVVKLFKDTRFRIEITRRAFQDIIESGRFTYKAFINDFDSFLEQVGVLNKTKTMRLSNVDLALYADYTIRYTRTVLKYLKTTLIEHLPGNKYLRSFVRQNMPWILNR